MKILKVIHGYPERYNAGSEVYSQTLCHGLIKQGHEVVVFARQQNAFKQEYSIEWEVDPACPNIKLCLVNMAHGRDGYRHEAVDRAFGTLLDRYQPEIVHIGHLNHLSTSLIQEANKRKLPVVFTLHDFWLMCPRGQFLQGINSKTNVLYPVCDGQQNEKCARHCYWRYFSSQDDQDDIRYWTQWVKKRMDHIRSLLPAIDLFIAPSQYLMGKFVDDFSIPLSQIVYLDYGFDIKRLQGRKRETGHPFTFGYIGTHVQAKGIFDLLTAFSSLKGNAELKIWGKPLQPFTSSLHAYVNTFNQSVQKRIFWMGGYGNDSIVQDVFNHTDAIVVPSIWGENSPLVIHEALEAKVPIITANYGGMKEYIEHEINGLLFEHRIPASLTEQMQRLMNSPQLATKIVKRGYLQSSSGRIPSIDEHIHRIEDLYQEVIDKRRSK